MSTVLLHLRQKEYIVAGGAEAEIENYSVQSLITKIKTHYPVIKCEK